MKSFIAYVGIEVVGVNVSNELEHFEDGGEGKRSSLDLYYFGLELKQLEVVVNHLLQYIDHFILNTTSSLPFTITEVYINNSIRQLDFLIQIEEIKGLDQLY